MRQLQTEARAALEALTEDERSHVIRQLLEETRPALADAVKHLWGTPADAPANYCESGVPTKVDGQWCYPTVSPDSDARLTGCSLQQAYMLGFDDAESVWLNSEAAP